jgi:chemotaxis protein CheY-P-specific phosphatase CheC
MTIEQVMSLTELEGDALGEIANIAMARAATSARQMVGAGGGNLVEGSDRRDA